jgi:hypothetical protein
MNKELLRAQLYDAIKTSPGITKNEMLDLVKDSYEGVNFSHVYLIVKKLIEDKLVKVDGKKKRTGHYLPDVDIPEDVPKPVTTPAGTTPQKFERNNKPTKRFVLEKNESNTWRTVDENDICEPITNLFNQCVRLVPLHYRVRDLETDTIINERQPQRSVSELYAEAEA